MSKIKNSQWSRRSVLKAGAASSVAAGMPMFYMKNAYAAEYLNDPGSAANVTLGFNVPQTGAYADEGADELRAYKLAVAHLNGEGDGGMLNTMQPSALKGEGILGKKVTYVTGDTQTKSDAARASAKAYDRKRWRHDGNGRFLFWCSDCSAIFMSRSRGYLHGRLDSLK